MSTNDLVKEKIKQNGPPKPANKKPNKYPNALFGEPERIIKTSS
jgi:hypothetical protein